MHNGKGESIFCCPAKMGYKHLTRGWGIFEILGLKVRGDHANEGRLNVGSNNYYYTFTLFPMVLEITH